MEYFVNCNNSSLDLYTIPLDAQKATHLYRRLGFSASVDTINQAIGMSADALVDQLVNEAINLPPIPAPIWADWNRDNYPEESEDANPIINEQRDEWRLAYGNALLNNNLRDRLSFFWHNHFVTELKVYNSNTYLYHYINCLQRNSIGNFKTFVSEIGLTGAMLFYLDGVFNNSNEPNENYARELYELFTLGEGNGYTEDDVIETAKALTGYVDRGDVQWSPIAFDPARHNADSKTIFGQTGNFGYDEVIDNLFTQRPNLIASFICKKFYEFFVHPDANEGNAPAIINGLATTFIANNYEIAPVLSQLFKSQHFFDDEAIGVIIKSPYDIYLNFLNETSFANNDIIISQIIQWAGSLSQQMFNPVDVAGWQRDRSWINNNFIIGRWITAESFITQLWNNDTEQFRTFGIAATNATGVDALTTNDPEIVARAIIDKLLPKGLFEEIEYTAAITVFRAFYEDNNVYPDDGDGSWNMMFADTPTQVYNLLQYIVRQPEFQLK